MQYQIQFLQFKYKQTNKLFCQLCCFYASGKESPNASPAMSPPIGYALLGLLFEKLATQHVQQHLWGHQTLYPYAGVPTLLFT